MWKCENVLRPGSDGMVNPPPPCPSASLACPAPAGRPPPAAAVGSLFFNDACLWLSSMPWCPNVTVTCTCDTQTHIYTYGGVVRVGGESNAKVYVRQTQTLRDTIEADGSLDHMNALMTSPSHARGGGDGRRGHVGDTHLVVDHHIHGHERKCEARKKHHVHHVEYPLRHRVLMCLNFTGTTSKRAFNHSGFLCDRSPALTRDTGSRQKMSYFESYVQVHQIPLAHPHTHQYHN